MEKKTMTLISWLPAETRHSHWPSISSKKNLTNYLEANNIRRMSYIRPVSLSWSWKKKSLSKGEAITSSRLSYPYHDHQCTRNSARSFIPKNSLESGIRENPEPHSKQTTFSSKAADAYRNLILYHISNIYLNIKYLNYIILHQIENFLFPF